MLEWRVAILERIRVLEKNKTWELSKLPLGKQAIRCKWIVTIKLEKLVETPMDSIVKLWNKVHNARLDKGQY